jgi:hypothetical protein
MSCGGTETFVVPEGCGRRRQWPSCRAAPPRRTSRPLRAPVPPAGSRRRTPGANAATGHDQQSRITAPLLSFATSLSHRDGSTRTRTDYATGCHILSTVLQPFVEVTFRDVWFGLWPYLVPANHAGTRSLPASPMWPCRHRSSRSLARNAGAEFRLRSVRPCRLGRSLAFGHLLPFLDGSRLQAEVGGEPSAAAIDLNHVARVGCRRDWATVPSAGAVRSAPSVPTWFGSRTMSL